MDSTTPGIVHEGSTSRINLGSDHEPSLDRPDPVSDNRETESWEENLLNRKSLENLKQRINYGGGTYHL